MNTEKNDSGEQQPVTREKIEVEFEFMFPYGEHKGGGAYNLSSPVIIPNKKLPLIKQAIEQVLNAPTPEPGVTGELYWKQRCEAAEMYINELPYKGTNNFRKWQQLKNHEVEPGQQNQDEWVSKNDYDAACNEIARLEQRLKESDQYIRDLEKGYEH